MAKLTWKIWLLIIVIMLSLISISPGFKTGIRIASVEQNSSAFEQGLKQGMILKSVDNQKISAIEDYARIITSKFPENLTEPQKIIINTDQGEFVLFTDSPPKIIPEKLPLTKIKTGLDLQGGARALLQAEKPLTRTELDELIAVTSNRLNVYGLTDITIRPVSDLAGNNYMLVEIAGSSPSELKDLISEQGKFEAKIGNETVFIGGNKDITYVARSGQESGIYSCQAVQGGEACQFRFAVYLSEEAAQRHADITSKLDINESSPQYLSKTIDFYVDDELLDSLFISKDLKGRATTQVSIQGSGVGSTRQEAFENAQTQMKKLQTILITGSLPYKLEIVKLDTISPILGQRFIYSILWAGFAAILAVGLVVLIRYRKIKLSLALLLTSFSEVIIILGIASLIKWNLDLPSIAGILAVIGTGVDQQIVILDESRTSKHLSIKQRLKRALFIIISAYFTSLVSLLPLYWAGAGLLKGFAVTTIIGITTAVLITRPAFADIVKKIEE